MVRSAILSGASELIQRYGVCPTTVARRAGLPLTALSDPDFPTPAPTVLRFFEDAAQACREPAWGLTLARSTRLAPVLGPLWILLRNARTVGQMCEELAENFDLYTTAAAVSVEHTREGALLEWTTTTGQTQSEVQMAEFAMCIFAGEIRAHLRPGWMPAAVLFRHARPAGRLPLHRQVLGTDLRFNQDRNALLLDHTTLDAPLKGRGPAARALASRLVRLEEHLPGKSLSLRVESVVRALMPHAPCSVGDVGRALGIAPRTLQMHLQRQGSGFQAVKDAVRADLALKYVRDSDLGAGEIAEILGYSDPTSFSRSFRRWHGTSARALRAQR